MIDKQQKKALAIDIVILSNSNIRKNERRKLEKKNQGLKVELEMIREVKATVVPVVIGALGAVTHSLGELLQQILGTTSVQNPQTPAELKEDTPPPP